VDLLTIHLEKRELTACISHGAQIKIDIVKQDSLETGLRKTLNFGHTIGHAIERISSISHGDAVSIGMVAALQLSARIHGLSQDDILRAVNLLKAFDLPVVQNIKTEDFWSSLVKDKKAKGDFIDFVLLTSIGESVIESIPFQELRELLDEQYAHLV